MAHTDVVACADGAKDEGLGPSEQRPQALLMGISNGHLPIAGFSCTRFRMNTGLEAHFVTREDWPP